MTNGVVMMKKFVLSLALAVMAVVTVSELVTAGTN